MTRSVSKDERKTHKERLWNDFSELTLPITQFSDEDIDVFVELAKERDSRVDTEKLRDSLHSIRRVHL